jgi:hypothetical protein
MIIYDKKKAITTMMAKRDKDGNRSEAPMVPSEVKDEDGKEDPRHAAAQDVLSAMNEKHPAKLMEALAAFHDLHMMHKESAKAEDAESSD